MPDPTHGRKYGLKHKRLRRKLELAIRAAGIAGVPCARCGEPITHGMRWDLGHEDGAGPDDYNGAEHVRCSRGTAGRGLANVGNRKPAPQPTPETHPQFDFDCGPLLRFRGMAPNGKRWGES